MSAQEATPRAADPAPSSGTPPLSAVIPPLLLGTATFNTQYVTTPESMPYTSIVSRALALGLRGFDTSPYYGPSEILLGDALRSVVPQPERASYFLVTKTGRFGPANFDYSPAAIRASIERSLERLGTEYLDLVYCHDVEFVSPRDVLEAVGELRRLRSEGKVRYVGISGYPVPVLASLATMVRSETSEPLDAVLSYSNYNLQNTTLASEGNMAAFRDAGVGVVLNASILSMGLLTTRGVDAAPMAVWHPAPRPLRTACTDLKTITAEAGLGLEEASIRWAMDSWATAGAELGTQVLPPGSKESRVGVTVVGVCSVAELEETWTVFQGVMKERELRAAGEVNKADTKTDVVRRLAEERIWPALGSWKDYVWESPGEDYVATGPSKPSK